MTTTETPSRFRYEGNGVTDTFSFPGRIFSAEDLVVEIILRSDDSLVDTLTLTTDYTVTINGPASASIEVTAPNIPSALQDIQIRRDLSRTQNVVLPTGTVFPAKQVETALDKLTAITQELQTQIDLKVGISITDSGDAPDVVQLLDDAIDGAAAAQAAAEAAQAGAETAETGAVVAQTAAEVAQVAAESARDDAEAASNSTVSALSTVTFEFNFDSSTSMADPGTGDFRLNNATKSSVTQIAISATTSEFSARDISSYSSTWGGSTNTSNKGTLQFVKKTDPTVYAIYTVNNTVTDNGAWLQIPVTHVLSNGTFTAADDFYICFVPTGDKGADGAGTGTVTSIATTAPISGGTITSTGTISLDINAATSGTVATADELLFGDVSASNVIRKTTVSDVLALATSSGGWVPIKTTTASAAATVDFVNGSGGVVLNSTYKTYAVVFSNVVPASDAVAFNFRSSTNAGSSYDSGAANYDSARYEISSAGASAGGGNDTSVQISQSSLGSDTGESISGIFYIFNPSATNSYPTFKFSMTAMLSGGELASLQGAGCRRAQADIDAVRFYFSSGNIESGTFTLYGLKDA